MNIIHIEFKVCLNGNNLVKKYPILVKMHKNVQKKYTPIYILTIICKCSILKKVNKNMVVKIMADETVQAVRNAEINAEQIEKDAFAECERIKKQADTDSKNILEKLLTKAKAKAQDALIDAKKQGEIISTEAQKEAAAEIEALKISAQSKEEKAIKAIVAEFA